MAGVKRPAPSKDPGVNVQEQLAVEQHGGNLIANLAALTATLAAQASNLPPFTGDWVKFWDEAHRVKHPIRESLDCSFLLFGCG